VTLEAIESSAWIIFRLDQVAYLQLTVFVFENEFSFVLWIDLYLDILKYRMQLLVSSALLIESRELVIILIL